MGEGLGLCPGGLHPRGVSVQGVSIPGGLCPGGRSMSGQSLSRMISVQGGLCPGGGVSVMENPPSGNEREVRILMECILVAFQDIFNL